MSILAVVSNIPTPYRLDFFDVLSVVLEEHGNELRVFFCATSECGRHWNLNDRKAHFSWEVLPGFHPRFGRAPAHVNPAVMERMRFLRPRWLLTAGSWFLPTGLLAREVVRRQGGSSIFWGEGHRQAVSHPHGPVAGLRRRVLSGFDGFAVPNQRSEQFYRKETKTNSTILRLGNSVNESYFMSEGPTRSQARAKLGIREARTVLLVSSMTPAKGVLEALEAYRRLSLSDRKLLNLVVLGDGPLMSKAISLSAIEEGIYLQGHKDSESVLQHLWASDVFLMNSRYDPNPLSMIEAAFAGLPIAATQAVGNVKEIVKDYNGWILENDSIDGVVGLFQTILKTDVSTLESMGITSRSIACRSFTRLGIARKFVDDLIEKFPVTE